jgi:UPF0755 protein
MPTSPLPTFAMKLWRLFKSMSLGLLVSGLLLALVFYGYVTRPMMSERLPARFEVAKGMGVSTVAKNLTAQGILQEPYGFTFLAFLTRKATTIKPGFYAIPKGQSMWVLLKRMEAGDILYTSVTFIEGSRFEDALQRLQNNPDLKPILIDVGALKGKWGVNHLDGSIFPDTYRVPVGSNAFDILQMARQKMMMVLHQGWENRDQDTPWQTPDEALIAASIIEKETALPRERPLVASVIVNRLEKGMPLAMDPTVIYGLGDDFNGHLTKKHLSENQPYNTYMRLGLPPGPICLPSKSAIDAAMHPAKTDWLYFVVDGQGGHVFSQSYAQHQRHVQEMLQRRKDQP